MIIQGSSYVIINVVAIIIIIIIIIIITISQWYVSSVTLVISSCFLVVVVVAAAFFSLVVYFCSANPVPSAFLDHNENNFFHFVLSQLLSISSFYICFSSYSYHGKVILVFLFNDLLFLTGRFLFCLYVFLFACGKIDLKN